ncbi:MAG TPA: hypothetical protein VLL76_00985 [Candidatus Omnitrophota bacterium]|nr:hypothetical protein [Candidatus Omnitrophota bacterium]
MVTGVHGIDSQTAIRRVNDTLQGPVVDILSQLVPDLKALPRAQAFERTLDDIALLDRCFQAFRAQRDKFRTVLIDERKRPVEDDATALSCGRTLNDVVAMVVRTAAKRYFRRKHGCAHKPLAPRLRQDIHDKGFAHRIKAIFADKPAEAPKTNKRADELYDALKEYLLHDWQVKLVPTYASMSPTLVRSLGAKLLEVREIDHLKRILDDPAEAAKLFDLPADAAAAVPMPARGLEGAAPTAQPPRRDERARLSDVLTTDGKHLRAEAFTAVLLRPEVRSQLKAGDQMMCNTEILRSVGAVPAKLLVAELGLRLDQLAVFLLVTHDVLGKENFNRMLGTPGNGEMVMRVTQKARLAGLTQQSGLSDVAGFVKQLFARFAA